MNSCFPIKCILCDKIILSADDSFSPSPVAEKGRCCAKCLYHQVEPALFAQRQQPHPLGIAQFPNAHRATWYTRFINRRRSA
jgi:hypothetical protein